MSWSWFALVPQGERVPAGALARATVEPLAFDAAGAPAQLSLLVLDRDHAPLFDDPAVGGAVRRVPAGPAPAAVTTLVGDAVHLAGAAGVVPRGFPRLEDDPFTRFGPTLRLDVGPGLFAAASVQASAAPARHHPEEQS